MYPLGCFGIARSERAQTAIDAYNTRNVRYKIKHKPQPKYPELALRNRLSNYCELEYTITKEGTTKNIKLSDCPDETFLENSIEAVKKFEYWPEIKNGKPVETQGVRNRFHFKLGG